MVDKTVEVVPLDSGQYFVSVQNAANSFNPEVIISYNALFKF